jgi:hypothetical protein
MPNRGFIRESVLVKKANLIALSHFPDDIAGTVRLSPRAPGNQSPRLP